MDVIDKIADQYSDDKGWWDVPFMKEGKTKSTTLCLKVRGDVLTIIPPQGELYTLDNVDVLLACLLKAKEMGVGQ